MVKTTHKRTRFTALILFFFLYCFGVHFFYLKQTKKALIQIGLFVLSVTFYTIWALQTDFGKQGGSIFFGLSWMVGLWGWSWGLANTIELTKK